MLGRLHVLALVPAQAAGEDEHRAVVRLQALQRHVGQHGQVAHRTHHALRQPHRLHAPTSRLALEGRLVDAGHGERGFPVGEAVEDEQVNSARADEGHGMGPERELPRPGRPRACSMQTRRADGDGLDTPSRKMLDKAYIELMPYPSYIAAWTTRCNPLTN
jgi:hypothetical protein